MITVYVSIGNSDDKLTQADWAAFHSKVNTLLGVVASHVHGRWSSLPTAPWQNACWCIEVEPAKTAALRVSLAECARYWRQDSIAWAEANTEFIEGATP